MTENTQNSAFNKKREVLDQYILALAKNESLVSFFTSKTTRLDCDELGETIVRVAESMFNIREVVCKNLKI